MVKKMVYLICCLVIANTAYSQDPNLIAHWKLDEGVGRIAEDSAGDYDGTLRGGPSWIDGVVDGALQFDGADDCVEIGIFPVFSQPEGSFSVVLWANIADWTSQWNHSMIGADDDSGWCLRRFGDWWSSQYPDVYTMPANALCFTTRGIGHAGDGVNDTPSNTTPPLNEWFHVTCVYDADSGMKYIYFDGAENAAWEVTGTISSSSQRMYIGCRSNSGDTGTEANFTGMLDDVRFYNRALSADEVAVLAVPPATVVARDPNPADGDEMVNSPLLQWSPADVATAHNVYLGTNPTLTADDLVSQEQTDSTYKHVAGLLPNTTYYWRIDEIEASGTVNTGKVWSFTSGPTTAFSPEPQDGYRWAGTDEGLSWSAGVGSSTHNVYLGTNWDDVAAGTGNTSKGNQRGTFYNAEVLENDTVYFWRIDEVAADVNTVYAGEVWRFKTRPDIQITDPNLVGWWKLDEGQGNVALDWSGYGNHGTLMGDPQWAGGPVSGALDFDGYGDYVDCGNAASLDIQNSISMVVWFKTAGFSRDWEAIITKGDGAYRLSRSATTGEALHMGINGTATEWFDGNREVTDDEWHHVAGVYDGQTATIYLDGAFDASTQSGGQINSTGDNFYIGENSSAGGRFFGGMIDDVRIYDRALSHEEVQQLMEGNPLIAGDPGPANGSIMDIRQAEPLSWSSGDGAVQHDVYLGTDQFDVDIADTSTPDVYRSRQGATGYNPPEGFAWGQDYYWRIDEVKADGTVTRGNVWSFTITDYLIVDNFEDYNDYPPDEVWNTWIDGYGVSTNGSSAGYPDPDFVMGEHYLETTIVHSGRQSLPLLYDNSVGLSEVTRTFDSMTDWTEFGVSTLTLWYYGVEDNDYEPMFIALNDAVVYNDDANAGLIPEWAQWDIPLQVFADKGVNLNNIGSMTIGFGNKENPTTGGAGKVFFDDIRLNRP